MPPPRPPPAARMVIDLYDDGRVVVNCGDLRAANVSFLVAWRDDRRLGVSAGGSDIFAAQVNSDGAVLDPSGISLTDSKTYDSQPAVAPGAGDTWSVLYRRFAVERQYGADRVFLRTVSPG